MSEAEKTLDRIFKVMDSQIGVLPALLMIKGIRTTYEKKLFTHWESNIRQEITKAAMKHNIDPEVLKEARRLLAQGIKFDLLYNNSREQYFGIKLKNQI